MKDDNAASCGCPTYWVEHKDYPCPYCEIAALTEENERLQALTGKRETNIAFFTGKLRALTAERDELEEKLDISYKMIGAISLDNTLQITKDATYHGLDQTIKQLQAELSRYKNGVEVDMVARVWHGGDTTLAGTFKSEFKDNDNVRVIVMPMEEEQ